ncbi:MAG: type II secretion system F family protein, partial [Pseudomonadales bacterium]|nr:type II secretion system F family protein [Pseudomonadales bacterium]
MNQKIYQWRGTDSLGLPQRGEIEAQSLDQAVSMLAATGIAAPILNQHPSRLSRLALPISVPKLTAPELAYFSRQLAALLAADISVTDALATLGESDRTKMRMLMTALIQEINGGASLSQAMATQPQVFNVFYLTLVRAGEAAANLSVVLTRLAAEIERKTQLSRNIRQALLQPMLILLTAIIAVSFLLVFVMPQFGALYAQQGQAMPQITRWVLGASDTLAQSGSHFALMAVIVIGLLAGTKYLGEQTRLPLHGFLLSFPLFGRWSRETNTAALCHTLATTLTAGIPLTQAIPYAAQTCRNEVFRQATQQLTGRVESGDRLWSAMREAACFPPATVRLVRLGEETGRLEALLTQAGLQCEDGLAQLQS